jgi:hypothetical protein
MAEFTLLKLQLEDASFTANAPFSDGDGDGPGESEPDSNGNGRRLLPFVIGFVFLLVVVLAVRKLRGDSEEE